MRLRSWASVILTFLASAAVLAGLWAVTGVLSPAAAQVNSGARTTGITAAPATIMPAAETARDKAGFAAAQLAAGQQREAAAAALLHLAHVNHLAHLTHLRDEAAARAAAARAAAVATSSVQTAPAGTSSGTSYSGGTYQGSGWMQQCIIARESGGNSQVMNSTGHYGLYQFSAGTWAAHGGNPADFGHASIAEQNQVYYNTVAADGYADWSPYDGC